MLIMLCTNYSEDFSLPEFRLFWKTHAKNIIHAEIPGGGCRLAPGRSEAGRGYGEK